MAEPRQVELARELERQDAGIAEAIGAVRRLEADVAELRARAEGIVERRAALPYERSRLESTLAETRERLAAREAEHAEAEVELGRAEREEDEAAARRAVTRTGDAVASARRTVAHTETELAELERDASRAEEELGRLRRRARELAGRLAESPRVAELTTDPVDLDTMLDWGVQARAALFVAAGGLETERERIVREANELGAAAFGEPALAASVTTVRERLERAAGGSRP